MAELTEKQKENLLARLESTFENYESLRRNLKDQEQLRPLIRDLIKTLERAGANPTNTHKYVRSALFRENENLTTLKNALDKLLVTVDSTVEQLK